MVYFHQVVCEKAEISTTTRNQSVFRWLCECDFLPRREEDDDDTIDIPLLGKFKLFLSSKPGGGRSGRHVSGRGGLTFQPEFRLGLKKLRHLCFKKRLSSKKPRRLFSKKPRRVQHRPPTGAGRTISAQQPRVPTVMQGWHSGVVLCIVQRDVVNDAPDNAPRCCPSMTFKLKAQPHMAKSVEID